MVGLRRMRRSQASGDSSAASGAPTKQSRRTPSSLVSVYQRSGAYFVVSSARTTAGVWVHDGEPRRLSETETGIAELGGELLARLDKSPRVVPHPAQHQWPEQRRESLTPILRLAGVRSWRSFVSTASLVEVEQLNGVVTISPMLPMPKPIGAFEPDTARTERLGAPSQTQLGEAILRAFSA